MCLYISDPDFHCGPKKKSKLKKAPDNKKRHCKVTLNLSIYSVFIQVFDKIRQSFLDKLRKSLKMSVNEIDFGIKFLLASHHISRISCGCTLNSPRLFFDADILCIDILYCRCPYY